MRKLLQGILVTLGFLLATCNGKAERLLKNENLAEIILKNSGYNNDFKHKKNLIFVVVAKEKTNADSNNENLAEILLKKSRYDLEHKKNLKYVNKEKPNTINNMIKPGNIIILKDNAVYIYDQESGSFIGRSIGSFLSKMLGTFGMNDRGGLLSVDLNSINFVHEPLIKNTFPGIVLGKNINKLKF